MAVILETLQILYCKSAIDTDVVEQIIIEELAKFTNQSLENLQFAYSIFISAYSRILISVKIEHLQIRRTQYSEIAAVMRPRLIQLNPPDVNKYDKFSYHSVGFNRGQYRIIASKHIVGSKYDTAVAVIASPGLDKYWRISSIVADGNHKISSSRSLRCIMPLIRHILRLTIARSNFHQKISDTSIFYHANITTEKFNYIGMRIHDKFINLMCNKGRRNFIVPAFFPMID